jgi:hypothetical protein
MLGVVVAFAGAAFARIPLQSAEISYGEHAGERLPAVIEAFKLLLHAWNWISRYLFAALRVA